MAIEVGQEAPDFELSQGFDKVKLSDYRGKENVVVVFYPFTFTGVCQGELCELRDDLSSCIGCGCLSLHACKLYNPDDRARVLGQGPRYLLGDTALDVVPGLAKRAKS